MEKSLIPFLILICSFAVNAQENKLLAELNRIDDIDNQVFHIIKNPVSNIKDNDLTLGLKKKLKSELNTIYSCMDSYANSKELKLDENEISELKTRVKNISSEFYKSKKYTLVKTSGGIAPIYGVGMDTILNKKVAIVYLGGDCSMTEVDMKWDEITEIFNKKMKSLLSK
ncbi:hypothetical protein [uncultured Aquimarina sp.]|uniref:hypothetical protein n=1 Tax=uncultured Aquimarina sp. TaxID=575652 RepID=UPI002610BD8B|nr:hypothetical protein [uncultured Aquimarina sp.]